MANAVAGANVTLAGEGITASGSVSEDDAVNGGTWCWTGSWNGAQYCGGIAYAQSENGDCPLSNNCSAGLNYFALPSFVPSGSSICGSDSCSYTAAPSNSLRQGLVQGDPSVLQVMINSGNSCTSTGANPAPIAAVPANAASNACTAGGGAASLCMNTAANGLGSETVNGTMNVIPGNLSQNQCVSAGGAGGVYCAGGGTNSAPTPPTSPPAPDNGTTQGTTANPVATVTDNGQTVYVFSPAQVAGSKGGVVSSNPTGTGSGCPASAVASGALCSGTGSGSGSGTASGACSGSTCSCDAGAICDDLASGGGDCSAPPSCSGDTVLCNAVGQAWAARCPQDTPAMLASVIAADGTSAVLGNYQHDVSSSFNETNGLPTSDSGTCPAPLTITMPGTSTAINLDIWAKLCVFAGDIAWVIMAVAYMIGGRITAGALLGRTV